MSNIYDLNEDLSRKELIDKIIELRDALDYVENSISEIAHIALNEVIDNDKKVSLIIKAIDEI